MGISIADALDRIHAAGVLLRVEGTALKASGVPLSDAQRDWLRANKLRVISEIETPSRCSCHRPVDFYGVKEDGSALIPWCELCIPGLLRAEFWPEVVT